MKLGMMQPYFFPYLGYFNLIKQTDFFILSDNVQYIRHGWIERNRILKQNDGWMYIRVPLLSHPYNASIKDIKIDNRTNWQETILKNLLHYKKKSPYYKETVEIVKNVLDTNTESICDLNYKSLYEVCKYLDINFDCKFFTEVNPDIPEVKAPDEWSLYTCIALGYDTYINPPGGIEIYNVEKYKKYNVDIKFLKQNLKFYSQRRGPKNFEPGLSIIDVLMFNSKEEIKLMLEDYTLI